MKHSDIYQRITQQIISAIEAGTDRFCLPWHSPGRKLYAPQNAVSGRDYRGINVLILWATAEVRGYTQGIWATYQQWQELGAQVRKGEKSTEVVLWKPTERKQTNDEEPNSEATEIRQGLIARGYCVFNVAQVDGYEPPATPELSSEQRLVHAERFFDSLRLNLSTGGDRAFYNMATDTIHLPEFKRFHAPELYYSTLAHECVHWTGSPARLNRQLANRFGNEAYAAEELIAELGAAFLSGRVGTFAIPCERHASYVASWLKLFRSDPRAIFTAASQAQRAVDWMCDYSAEWAAAA